MKKLFYSTLFVLIYTFSFAQTPTEQDCLGAIPLCFDNYYTTASYSGTGNYPNEIGTYPDLNDETQCPGNCLLAGELNDVWYTFTVQAGGNVAFTISPNNTSDDYDWAVYNLTNANCSDILTDESIQTSCNFCNVANQTGPNGAGTTNCEPGINCSPYNSSIPVSAGEIYVVNVSNFSSSQSGYTIDFGGSTAQIVDNTGPSLQSIINSPACGQNVITVEFDENVLCSSVGMGDFSVTGPGGPYSVTNIYSVDCAAGATYSRVFELTLNQALTTGGTYSLNLVDQIDDICSHSTNLNSLSFSVSGITTAIDSHTDIAVCNGDNTGQIIASASGGTSPYTYSIPGESNNTGTFNNLYAGTYLVTITDNIGVCNEVHTVQITEPNALTVGINPVSPIILCSGDDLNLSGNPAGGSSTFPSHIWYADTALLSTIENPFFNTTGIIGTYDIIYTAMDSYGCSATDSVLLTINPTPNIDSVLITDVTTCSPTPPDGSIQVYASGGAPALEYSINGGAFASNDFFTGLGVGNHAIIVQDVNGCSHDTSLTINTNNGFFIDSISSTDLTCFNDNNGQITVYVTGGSLYSIDGSNYQTDSNFTGLSAGTYSVIAQNIGGCYSSVWQDTITQPDQIIISANIDSAYCGNTGSIDVSVVGGVAPYTYLWDNDSTTADMSNLAAGDYILTLTDDSLCVETFTATVVNAGGTADVDITNILNVACWGDSTGSAMAVMASGVSPFNYQWDDPLLQQTQTASNLSAGTYIVIVSDAYGCAGTDTVIISSPQTNVSAYIIDFPTSCYGGSNGYAQVYTSGGTSPYTYSWPGSQVDSSYVTGFAAGNYTLTITDNNNCISLENFSVSEPSGMTISSELEISSDYYGIIDLTVYGGAKPYSYSWSGTEIKTNYISGLDAGIHLYIPEHNHLNHHNKKLGNQ